MVVLLKEKQMTRLHFKTNEQGNLVTKPLMSDKGLVVVTLNPSTLAYRVDTFETQTEVCNGNGDTLVSLKTEIKDTLRTLGVPFLDEVRQRTKVTTETQNVVNG